jgi:PAS domain S-box-containing protein
MYFIFSLLICGALVFSGWCLYQRHLIRQERNQIKEKLLLVQSENLKLQDDQQNIQQTESRLRDYLKLMDILINTIPTPIYFKEVQGVYQGCNKMFAKNILGLTRDRIIGKRPHELPAQIPPDLASTYQNQELRMLEKERMHSFEAQVQCADGERRDFLFNLAPVWGPDHQIDACVAVLSDLTEKNRALLDRLENEKLQSALETTGAVCHELNQPLQALSGYVEILSARLASDKDHGVYLEKISRLMDRMRDITDKLQGITRYETTGYGRHTRILDIHKASQKRADEQQTN